MSDIEKNNDLFDIFLDATKSQNIFDWLTIIYNAQELHVPATSSSRGTVGQLAWDATYWYICTATNTWKRVAWTGTSW